MSEDPWSEPAGKAMDVVKTAKKGDWRETAKTAIPAVLSYVPGAEPLAKLLPKAIDLLPSTSTADFKSALTKFEAEDATAADRESSAKVIIQLLIPVLRSNHAELIEVLEKLREEQGEGRSSARSQFESLLRVIASLSEDLGTLLAHIEQHPRESSKPTKPTNLPYGTLASLFKGREAFLERLGAQLTKHDTAIIRAQQAIHGMGGVGKTRVASPSDWTRTSPVPNPAMQLCCPRLDLSPTPSAI